MIRIVFFLLLQLATVNLFAQSFEKRFAIGIHGGASQYFGDLTNKYYDFTETLYGTAAFSLNFNLGHHWDIGLFTTYGETGFNQNEKYYFRTQMVSTNFNIRFKCLKHDAIVNPFLFAGAGNLYFNMQDSVNTTANKSALASAGAGLIFKITPVVHIQLTETFIYSDWDNIDGKSGDFNDMFLLHSIGVTFYMGNKKDDDNDGIINKRDLCNDTRQGISVDKSGCPKDADADGTPDYLDACPDAKGLPATKGCPDADEDLVADKDDLCPDKKGAASLNGCPDRDGDNIPDKDDACPDVKGLSKFNGCPDTDNDGFADAQDACPDVYGLKEFNGCPDSDTDGIPDKDDKCPTIKGAKEFEGCPQGIVAVTAIAIIDTVDEQLKKSTQADELKEKALHGIQFEIASEILKIASYSILDDVALYLQKYPDVKLNISGHTDAVGDSVVNQTVSSMRAFEVKKYLVNKGVESKRLTAKGYGKTKPIATNKTAQGRAANRRVELEFVF